MAEITAFTKTRLWRNGNTVIDSYRFTIGNGAADEFITTGLSNIVAVLGAAKFGSAPAPVEVVPNAEGTGDTEGAAPGSIGAETAAGTEIFVTVVGTV